MLEVSGWTSYGTELKPQVKLSPAVYVAQPEWWDIAILERADAIFPEGDPYKVTLDLAHCKGKKGVRVVGKRKRQELPWPQTPTR